MPIGERKTVEYHEDRGMYLARIVRGSQVWLCWFGDEERAKAFTVPTEQERA